MDLSIIVPIYHGRKFIPNLLKMLEGNIKEAKGYKIEILFINDSPEEDITDLVKDTIVRVVNNSRNLGIQGARIKGITEARGKYILMLDQDDKLASNAVYSQLSKIGDADAILANGYSERNGKSTPLYRNERQKNLANKFSYYLYYGNMIASPGVVLIKKSKIPLIWMKKILKNNGSDDWLLWASYIKNGNKFMLNTDYIYTHKDSGSNFSDDDKKMLISSIEALNIAKEEKLINEKEFYIHKRRLEMREKIVNNPNAKKREYLLNIDIAIFLFLYKLI